MISSGLYFRCVVSDAAGSKVTSDEVKVLAAGESFSGPSGGSQSGSSQSGSSTPDSAPLTIETHPADVQAAAGNAATFKVAVSGGKAPYTYKWESKVGSGGWSRVYDSISNTLTKYPTQDMVTADQYYRCVITDADGKQVITDPAKILNGDQTGNGTAPGTQSGTTVVPVIPVNPVDPTDPSVGQGLHVTRHPVDVVVQKNQTAVFNAEVTGGKPPYSYNWQYKVGDSRWEDSFDSFTNVVKTEVHAAWAEAGMYIRCKIMDKDANVVYTHSAKAIPEWYADVDNTTPAGFPLTLIEQPEDKRGANGDEMIFKVDVIGGHEPYSFRWQSCTDTTSWEQNLTCDGSVLTVYPTAAMADAGLRYRCIVTDDHGTELISREAAVSGAAKGELQIVTQPRNVTTEYVPSGLDVLSVEVAGGTPPYHYQWQSTSLYNTDGSFHDMSQENFNMYDYSGFNGPDLTVPIIKEERYINRRFRCVITDAAGNSVTSRVAKYESGYDRFMILEHPYDVQVDRNAPEQEVTFTVRPTGGAGAYRYYWEYTHDGLTDYEAPTEKDTWATGWFEDTLVTTSRPPYSNMRFRCFVEDFIGYGYEMSEPAQLITGR